MTDRQLYKWLGFQQVAAARHARNLANIPRNIVIGQALYPPEINTLMPAQGVSPVRLHCYKCTAA